MSNKGECVSSLNDYLLGIGGTSKDNDTFYFIYLPTLLYFYSNLFEVYKKQKVSSSLLFLFMMIHVYHKFFVLQLGKYPV